MEYPYLYMGCTSKLKFRMQSDKVQLSSFLCDHRHFAGRQCDFYVKNSQKIYSTSFHRRCHAKPTPPGPPKFLQVSSAWLCLDHPRPASWEASLGDKFKKDSQVMDDDDPHISISISIYIYMYTIMEMPTLSPGKLHSGFKVGVYMIASAWVVKVLFR